ncbi:MAG: hypothetical protein Q9Q40_08190 [Acidobacteriota bacterium]|nr:hypothetical protein [Acidobacteriota bacterium]MDQ7087711.1 hypothetical protein [Acidobacteriota bacterium]
MRPWALALLAAGSIWICQAQVADQVFVILQRARQQAGAPLLLRDPALDSLARSRAKEVASRPPDERMAGHDGIIRFLRARGGEQALRAWERLDLSRGEDLPARAIAGRWQRSTAAWRRALAADGCIFFTQIFAANEEAP